MITAGKWAFMPTKKVADLVGKYMHGGRILDAGCGGGDLAIQLAYHFDVVGVDPSKEIINVARKKHELVVGGANRDSIIKEINEMPGELEKSTVRKSEFLWEDEEGGRIVIPTGNVSFAYGFVGTAALKTAQNINAPIFNQRNFDGVVLSAVSHYFPDLYEFVKKVNIHLRAGGKLFMVDYPYMSDLVAEDEGVSRNQQWKEKARGNLMRLDQFMEFLGFKKVGEERLGENPNEYGTREGFNMFVFEKVGEPAEKEILKKYFLPKELLEEVKYDVANATPEETAKRKLVMIREYNQLQKELNEAKQALTKYISKDEVTTLLENRNNVNESFIKTMRDTALVRKVIESIKSELNPKYQKKMLTKDEDQFNNYMNVFMRDQHVSYPTELENKIRIRKKLLEKL